MVDLSKAMLNNQRIYIYIDLYVIVIKLLVILIIKSLLELAHVSRNGDVHRF